MESENRTEGSAYFRDALATLGWSIVGSGARLGISRRHAQRLAAGDILVTKTIRRLLEAHLELKLMYEQRDRSWGTSWRTADHPATVYARKKLRARKEALRLKNGREGCD